jgi:diguanylate cyclase (GGDEF)-like protein
VPSPTDILFKDFLPEVDNVLAGVTSASFGEMERAGHKLSAYCEHAILLIPVVMRDATTEILLIKASSIQPDDLFLLKSFSRLYRNFVSLLFESERDPLTGLYNRRLLETRLDTVMRESERRHNLLRGGGTAPVTAAPMKHYLAVLDIDKFKRVNDTLGHLFGDEIILLVSRIMQETFRGNDTLFRFGGDEFVVILLASSRENAKAAFNRFRAKVAEQQFPQIGHVTVSMGFTQIENSGPLSNLIGRADHALYQAKLDGRNCVRDYEDLAARGADSQPLENREAEFF